MPHPKLLNVSSNDKKRLKLMFLAKHACSGGEKHAVDGNHAVYHHEVLTTLQEAGFNVTPANDFSALNDAPDADYIFTLLNRAGFPMSEMLGPLMAMRHNIPFLGASPIVRGLGDDKHLMKSVAKLRGVPVTPWTIVRQGQNIPDHPGFDFKTIVAKPNASSASWGVGMFADWKEAQDHIRKLLDERHDVIVEDFAGDYDIVVPIIGGDEPFFLPTSRFEMPGEDEGNYRSYEEKRGLGEKVKEQLITVDDAEITDQLRAYVTQMLPEVWPFDYGRFEFRYDKQTGDFRFMEVNLSCNLWSKKTVSGAARTIGITHAELIEHLVAYSMERQGLITAVRQNQA